MASYEDDVEPMPETMQRARSSTPSSSDANKRPRSDQDSNPNTPNKKPKDSKETKEISPEPDEIFDVTPGVGKQMWLVKVPNFLLNEWKKVEQEDVQLGTVRVFKDENGESHQMELRLPSPPAPAVPSTSGSKSTINIPRVYDMRSTPVSATRARNLYAFRETFIPDEEDEDEDEDGGDVNLHKGATNGKAKGKEKVIDGSMLRRKGKRYTELAGTISNEAALKPQMASSSSRSNPLSRATSSGSLISPEYREVMRKRKEEALKPKRSVILVNDDSDGEANRITSGISSGKNKGWSFAPANRAAGSNKEKMVRLPLNELHDLIFRAFEQYPYWTSKALRERTQQPEAYLKEALVEVADLQKRGPYANSWSLKDAFKKKAESSSIGMGSGGVGNGNGKEKEKEKEKEVEGEDEDEDDDDDEDEDFDNFPID